MRAMTLAELFALAAAAFIGLIFGVLALPDVILVFIGIALHASRDK